MLILPPIQMVPELFLWVNLAEPEVFNSPPSSANVKNEYRLMAWTANRFFFWGGGGLW